ncbi:MBL fold metallo-hydrolase [Micrococcaceae bacterium Sec6.3]
MPATSKNRVLHDLPGVSVRVRPVSAMDNDVYLLTSKTTGAQVLIDAADDADAIEALLASADVDTPCETWLAAIVTTHRHWDHVRALAEVAGAHEEAVLYAGADDAAAIAEESGEQIDRAVGQGDRIAVDGLVLDVIALRGHTPGSIALAYEPGPDEATLLFTGDSLFPGGVGSTEKDPERFASLLADVTARLFDVYDDDTHVHPGHGDSTTLGDERPHLPEWAERGW